MRYGHASDFIVVPSQEMLVVGVSQISDNDRGAGDHDVVSGIGVQMDAPCDPSGVANGMIEFKYWA